MVQLRAGSLSVTGNFRENNEDRFHADPDQRFFIVADGMGGQSAGEKASQLAVEIIPKLLNANIAFGSDSAETIIKKIDVAVAEANNEIMALGEIDPALNKMGTTVVFLLHSGEDCFVGGVGDSRVYRIRSGQMEQLTTDHSLTQALLDAGTISAEEAPTHKYRNMLYRYLGSKEGGTGTNPVRFNPEPGDRYMLCSDGVCDGLDDLQIETILAQGDDPQEVAEKIVQAALDGGSKDNTTCVVVYAD